MSNRLILLIALVAGLLTGGLAFSAIVLFSPAQNHVGRDAGPAERRPVALAVAEPGSQPAAERGPQPGAERLGDPVGGSERDPGPPPTPTRTPAATPTPTPGHPGPDSHARPERLARPLADRDSERIALAELVLSPAGPGRERGPTASLPARWRPGWPPRPGRILVITDYDGTLAEIDRDPMAARLVPGAGRALAPPRPDRRRPAGPAGPGRPDRPGRGRRRRAGPGRRRALSRQPRPRPGLAAAPRPGRAARRRRRRGRSRTAVGPARPDASRPSSASRPGCSSRSRAARSPSTTARPRTRRPPSSRSTGRSRRSSARTASSSSAPTDA